MSCSSTTAPLELIRAGSGALSLISFDDGGTPIDRLPPFTSLISFLSFAISVSEALYTHHSCGLVMKSVRPSCILYNAATAAVTFIEYGSCSLLSRDCSAAEWTEDVDDEQVFYMSPEQSGRMNRSIDSRSDLYSLGCVFYFLLTQQRPYEGNDVIDIIHAHIARPKPKLPSTVLNGFRVPRFLSGILDKLLEKTPEDRYQSALGLRQDLAHCRAIMITAKIPKSPSISSPASVLSQQQEADDAFFIDYRLGEADTNSTFRISQKLYGRAAEVEVLTNTVKRVSEAGFQHPEQAAKPEFILVSGYSGVGKVRNHYQTMFNNATLIH